MNLLAYGEAATVVFEVARDSMPQLCALVGYYPTESPNPAANYPPNMNAVVHLTESQAVAPRCRHYTYPDAKPGFADVNLAAYDKVATGLAWSRTLAAVRKGFEIEVDLEKVWEEHIERKWRQTNRAHS